ncbi:MAG: hypothetical protein RR490_08855, partial [Niameybacter sp.]
IPKSSIPDAYDGDVVNAKDYNRDNDVLRSGINANYTDIQLMQQGKTMVLVAPNGDMKALRLNEQFIIEYSVDGERWFPTYGTGPAGPAGAGIIRGGKAGQVLAKMSDVDYDTYWVDVLPTWGKIQGDITQQQDLMDLLAGIKIKSAKVSLTILVNQWNNGVYRLENALIKGAPSETTQEWIMPPLASLTEAQKQTILSLNLLDNGQADGWAEVKAGVVPTIDIPMIVILRGEV